MGPGGCLGTANCQLPGDSGDEMSKLKPKLVNAIDFKPLSLTSLTVGWTAKEDMLAMTWITSDEHFANFKLKKKDWFPKLCTRCVGVWVRTDWFNCVLQIAHEVLSASKTVKQVFQWWYQHWHLFQAVHAHQEHTGGELGEPDAIFGILAATLDVFEDSNLFQLLDDV